MRSRDRRGNLPPMGRPAGQRRTSSKSTSTILSPPEQTARVSKAIKEQLTLGGEVSREVEMGAVAQAEQELEHVVEQAWQDQEPAYRQLARLVKESPEVVYGHEALERSVAEVPRLVTCIDERAETGEPRIGIAGCGVLMETTDVLRMAKKLSQVGIEQVADHEGCGACALYAEQYREKHGVNLDPARVGVEVARSLKELLELEGPPAHAGYGPSADIPMRGDKRFHDARVIIIDGTGRFNPNALGLSPAFLLSARYEPSPEYTQQELGIAISIAIGPHGFGYNRFRDRAPLAVILVGDASNADYNVDTLEASLRHVLDTHRDIVTVLKLVPPVPSH